jgi:hypothetical protein
MATTTERMVRLRSLGRHKYRGRWVSLNEVFECSEEDAADLCSKPIGLAERIEDEDTPDKPRRGYKRRDMEPEQ